ncbi:MAG: ribonuclease III [Tissierellia bacterium]|nr:ribonuclease III [Tissierellia bacterium]
MKSKNDIEKYKELCKKLDYNFKDINLLINALTHSSFLNENKEIIKTDNQLLEFLGDAVIDLAVAAYLFTNSPQKTEGILSNKRTEIVNEKALAMIANSINLGDYLLLGKGETKDRGYEKPSILSDALEAVIGAVFIDSNYDISAKVFLNLYDKYMKELFISGDLFFDYKSLFHEEMQRIHENNFRYEVVSKKGSQHDTVYTISLKINDRIVGEGKGSSIKKAEQAAAYFALKAMDIVE